ncbi:M15 family metallopeptidase [Halobacillus naozhouensis]|uniref:M15 family metallopeptidase n=1 Tax=Halobacillus naozhouensis TaxID=554880 RepID=A0ABY8J583_9BACI|nr:M15 family metallopeptidase [Halobacillus naozhouensis]WFT76041.1 M15 family metallopeptidase [Halobacillus naozhouensis]
MKWKYIVLGASLSVILSGCSLDQFTSSGNEDGQQTSTEQPPSSDEGSTNEQKQTGEGGNTEQSEQEQKEQQKEEPEEPNVPAAGEKTEEKKDSDGLTVVSEPKSMHVVVNKQRKLPDGYTPPDLVVPDVPFYFTEFHPKKQMRKEAAKALEELFAAASKDGIDLVAASGYRSYERQKSIYQQNVAERGKEEANQFSAKPGTSEHQTGLAMDVTSAQMAFKLKQTFSQTDEGEWLAKHAHKYGFIIRYPKGKSDITGYSYEPWHLRYVGTDISTEIHNQEETLEEFFGFYPAS